MTIISCIKDLLKLENKVVIPGLGFFTQETESASVSLGEASFSPPKHTLNFINDKYVKGDQLESYLAHKKQIDMEDARMEVEVFIDKLRHIAENDDEFLIDGLGIFQGRNGKLRFNPESFDKIVSATLPAFKSEPIERSKQEKTQSISNSSDPVKTKYDREKVPIEWWRYIIGILLLTIFSFLIGKMIKGSSINKPIVSTENPIVENGQDAKSNKTLPENLSNDLSEKEQLEAERNAAEDDEKLKQKRNDSVKAAAVEAAEAEAKAQAEAAAIAQEKDDLIESITIDEDRLYPRFIDTNKCAIIVGNFGDPRNENRMKKKLTSLGYAIFSEKSKWGQRIGALVHCDEQTVRTSIAELRNRVTKDAWLMENY